jgi:hypothetical protein
MREIITEVTSTETRKVVLIEDDFETWPPTPEQIRSKALDIFESPDLSESTGPDYDVRWDDQPLRGG